MHGDVAALSHGLASWESSRGTSASGAAGAPDAARVVAPPGATTAAGPALAPASAQAAVQACCSLSTPGGGTTVLQGVSYVTLRSELLSSQAHVSQASLTRGLVAGATADLDARAHGRSHPAAGPALDLAAVTQIVNGTVERILGQAVSPDAPLMAAGLDSLGATEVHASLQNATQLELPPTLIFDYPSCDAIATYLHGQMRGSTRSQRTSASGVGMGAGGPMRALRAGVVHVAAVAVVGASADASPGVGPGRMLRWVVQQGASHIGRVSGGVIACL